MCSQVDAGTHAPTFIHSLPRLICREMDGKWSRQDPNWRPHGMSVAQVVPLPSMPQCWPLENSKRKKER